MRRLGDGHSAPALIGLSAIVVCWLGVIAMSEHVIIYALCLVLFLLCLVPIWIGIRRGPIDWCEGIYLYSWVYFLTFGGSAIYVLNTEWRYAWFIIDLVDNFDVALVVAIVGFAMVLLGYYGPFGERLASRLPRFHVSPQFHMLLPIAVAIIYVIGWTPRLLLLSKGQHLSFAITEFSGELSATDTTFNYMAWGTVFAYVLVTIRCFSRPTPGWWTFYLAFMVPVDFVYTFLSGSKFYFIALLVAPLLAYNYLRRRARLVHFLLPWVVFVFVVFPLIGAYRSSVKYGDLKLATFFTDFPQVVEKTVQALDDQPSAPELAALRTMDIQILTQIIENTPVVGLQYGRTVFWLSAAVIVPTRLWPEKYDLLTDMLRPFYMLWGQSEDPTTGVAGTQVGELFFNFHIFGVVAGMFVVGVLLRASYAYFISQVSPLTVFLYMGVWPLIGWSVEAWIFHLVNYIVKNLLFMLVLAWFINGGRLFERRKRAVAMPVSSG